MNRRWQPYVEYLFLITLLAASYLFFFHRLGNIGFIGPDEPRYASIAEAMVKSGDYITPRLNGEAWFEKPALMYWGASIGDRIFGFNEWGARFPSALAATLMVFLVYWCGRRLWDRKIGFIAALTTASSIGTFAFARAASMDMPLTACLTAALVFFLVGYHDDGPDRRWWFYFFYISLGFGVLAKGPVALLLPGLSLFGFMAVRHRLDEWKEWSPGASWLALAVPLPWYTAVTLVNGSAFLDVFIINQNIERYTSTIHGHIRPFYFYLPVLVLLTFPWTFMLIPTLRRTFGRTEQILLWWAVVPLLFFSFAGSKLPGYILPMVPPIALLCANELSLPATKCFKVAVYIEAGVMAFIGVAFGFFGSSLNVDPHVSGMLIAGITAAVALGLVIIALWLPPSFLVGFNAIVIGIVLLVGTNLVFPRFDVSDTMHPWKAALQAILPDPQTVYMYRPPRWAEYGLQYYRSDARSIGSPEELLKMTANGKRLLCVTEDKSLDELTRMGNIDLQIVDTIGGQTAFWVWQAP